MSSNLLWTRHVRVTREADEVMPSAYSSYKPVGEVLLARVAAVMKPKNEVSWQAQCTECYSFNDLYFLSWLQVYSKMAMPRIIGFKIWKSGLRGINFTHRSAAKENGLWNCECLGCAWNGFCSVFQTLQSSRYWWKIIAILYRNKLWHSWSVLEICHSECMP